MSEPLDPMRNTAGTVTSLEPGALPRLLIIVAAESEARAIGRALGLGALELSPWVPIPISPRADLLLTGVGKSNAAGATASALAMRPYDAAINLGIAGALPGLDALPALSFPLSTGAAIIASTSVFADEGLCSPGGVFQSLAEMGFPMKDERVISPGAGSPAFAADAGLMARLAPLANLAAPVATVSTCSGTHALAIEVARRTGALAECMEGAAAALACSRRGVAFAELRVISNTTGDRPSQVWKVREALERLGVLAGGVLDTIGGR